MNPTEAEIAPEKKSQALRELLASRTMDRSEQMRAFLRYVCELEIQGKADEITEYSIGVHALGRSDSFIPVEDSIVRNRAHGLRRKLQEYYLSENPSATVTVELPRGSYVPRWVERKPELPAVDSPPAHATQPVVAPVAQRPTRHGAILLALAFGVAATVATLWLTGPLRSASPVHPLVQEMWGPLVTGRGEVLLCLTAPPQLFVRKVPAPSGVGGSMEGGPVLDEYYRSYGYIPRDGKIHLIPTWHSPLLGDSLAIATATRMLGGAGARYQILTEQVTQVPNMLGRSAIVVGRPEYSPLVRRYLESGPLTIDLDAASREVAVIERRTGKSLYLPGRESSRPGILTTYGIVAVLPGEGPPGTSERLVVFSGVSSAGTHAAAEFFAAPGGLAELKRRLGGRRDRYTAVIRAGNERNLPVNEQLIDLRLH